MKTSFFALTGKALLIWLATNAIASLCYALYMLAEGGLAPLSDVISFDMLGAIILIGLAFSFPANLFLVPGLYMLNMLRRRRDKLAYAIGIVLFLCLGVILFFFQFFDVPNRERPDIIVFLLPYIIGAEISFLFVARKLITENLARITEV